MPKRAREDPDDVRVDDAPTSIDPYAVLGVEKDASGEAVKKAYRKAALQHHPDKVAPEQRAAAHTRFQEVAFAFAILSDARRRARYDATGRTEESLGDGDDDDGDGFDWADFFRAQFRDVVSEAAIDRFAREYRGSDEERAAVLAAYAQHRGDMARLYEAVMLSDMLEDEPRFRAIIDAAVAAGRVPEYPAYARETEAARRKRMDRARKARAREARQALEARQQLDESGRKTKKEKNGSPSAAEGDGGDLAAMIQKRQRDRGAAFFDRLEEKYGGGGGGGKRRGSEPREEAFAANRKGKKSSK